MVLVIFLTNVLIRKIRGMMNITQIEKKTYKCKRTTKKVFKKNFCTKEDISSSDEDEVSDIETERVIFMELEDSDKEDTEEEYEEAEEEFEEVEVDYRE
jgi:hypothetical protein